jgi:hypothetical protein
MKAAAVLLGVLLFVLTFNAYACLLPLPPSPASMPADCPSSDHGVPQKICDAFTTIGPQSSADPVQPLSLAGCPLLDQCSDLFAATVISTHTHTTDPSFSAPTTHCSITSTVLRI